jgi:Mce-associated membrane protein
MGAALLVGSLAANAVLAVDRYEQRAVADAGQQALATAQQYAVILTSVDDAKLDENFAAVLDGATGEFKKMYSESSSQLKQVLIDNKARADGKVIAAGIKSASKDKVEVMLFVDQAITNALNPQPRVDRNRIIMTMDKVDGRWLASDVVLP